MDFRFHADAIERQAVGHLDANETLFFQRELERIEATPYDILYPDLKARQLLPLGQGLGPADEFNTWRQFDKFGQAVEGTMESDEIPEVEVKGAEFSSRVVAVLQGYSYTIQEIRAAAAVNRPLDSFKASAARELVERKFEALAAVGSVVTSTNFPCYGALNQPNVGHIAVSTGTSSTGFTNLTVASAGSSAANQIWGAGGKTPKEIIRDLNNAYVQVVTRTNGIHSPNTLVLDLASYTYLNSTQVNDADTAIFTQGTILKYIMDNLPWLKEVEWWLPCGAASAGGAAGPATFGGSGSTGTAKTRAMLYEKNMRYMQMFIPQEFEQFAPQLINYKFKIPCHGRHAGVVVRYPGSMVYIDGIGSP